MRQDLPEGHPVFAAAAKVRDELAERHVQLELALAHQRQHERCRRELGERREIEQ